VQEVAVLGHEYSGLDAVLVAPVEMVRGAVVRGEVESVGVVVVGVVEIVVVTMGTLITEINDP
jgi:hypothetical protein